MACLLIQLDLHRACHERRRRYGRAVGLRHLEGFLAAAHGRRPQVCQSHRLSGSRIQEACPVKLQFRAGNIRRPGSTGAWSAQAAAIRRIPRPQKLRRLVLHLLQQLSAGSLHGLSRHIGGAGRIGSGVVGGSVRIRPVNGDLVCGAVQALRSHLGQDGIAASSHVCCSDGQRIVSVLIELDGSRAHVHAGDPGALHGHGDADTPHLSISHVPAGEFFLPADHLRCTHQTLIQGTACRCLTVIGRHHISLTHHIFETQLHRIHVQLFRQLVDCRLHGKDPLGGSVAPVGSRRHHVGIDHVVGKPVSPGSTVQRNGLMAGKSHSRGAVLAICSSIR